MPGRSQGNEQPRLNHPVDKVSCVLFWFVMWEWESECVNNKSFQFQLMHCEYDYTLYFLTTHLDYPDYTCAFRGWTGLGWRSGFHSRKQQATRSSVKDGSVTKDSHVGVSLSSSVQPPSMKMVQLVGSQHPAWQWMWKQSPMPSTGLPQGVTVRPHMPTSVWIQWAHYKEMKSGMESPDQHVSMFDIHHQNLLWVYCTGHAGVKGNYWLKRLAGKATITSGLCLRKSEVLRNLRLWAQSQGHRIIDRMEERGKERGSARWAFLKGQVGHHPSNIGTVSKAAVWKLQRDGVERVWAFVKA